MIKVSDLATKAISANSRTFLSRFLHNGAVISGDVRSVITHKGSCGESTFTPGAIYSSYIDVVIDNCKESLSGKELTYQIGVVIDENTTEWYDVGKYTVHKPSTDVYTTSFTALGRISAKLGMMYQSKLTFPTTIQNILDEISGNTGVSIIATGFDTSGVIENEITGYMYREVLAIIAGIFFAYATEDSAGNIVFANFKNGNIIRTDGDRTSVLPKFADMDTEITGVRVSGGEITVIDPETGDEVYQDQTFVSGNANVAIQNEFMTQALFDANAGNVIGFTFRPATVSISLGDFRIEPFDSLLVTDSLGVERTVPCMSIIHRFDGGIITEVVAPELQDNDSGTAFKGMFSQAIQRFQHDLISVKNLLAGTVTAEEVKANYATIDSLNTISASIEKLQTDKLDASVADLKYATISSLQVAVGRISKLETDSLTAESAVIKALQTDKLDALAADLKYATITNLNAATASIEKLQADKLDASAADLKYATISNLEAEVGRISKLEADSLTAESAVIKNLQTEKLDAASADLKYATISNLNAATGRISKLETDSLTAESAIIKALQTDKLDAETADLKYATISSLNATNANITKLQSEKATVGQLEAVDGKIEDLTSKAITTENLSASVAELGYATVLNLNAAVGRISKLETDSLTAESAVIKSLQTDKLDASSAELKYATISNLNAAVGRISKLETDSLTAESAIIKSLQSDMADIDTLIFGSATGTVIQTSFSNAVIARLGNAQIKSAMIDSLSADKITSGSINTNNVSIQSADGSMVIADNTIQIKDGSTVRVQIGKDASGNYSIVICDTSGNVMFNTNGITADAIKSAIIRDGMVADNANISAGKLNIDSLFTEINDSTKTIKSTRIYMDDVGQTLDIAYNTAVTAVTNIGNTVNTHGTQISAIQGQITSKVWQQDIDTVKNSLDESIDTLSTQYSTLNQTVSGLNSTVASHTSQIASKADKSTLTTVSNKVTELEQSLDGFKLSVSSTYATKSALNTTNSNVTTAQNTADSAVTAASNAQADVNALTNRVTTAETQITQNAEQIALRATKTEVSQTLSGYYTKTQTDAAITTKANQITSTIEKTYQKTVSKGEQLITNGNGLMGDNTNFSTWTFDGAIANNSAGSFTKAAGSAGTYTSDEFFPVNPTNEYTFSLDAKSSKGVGKLYSMLMFFDADKQQISAGHHIYNSASTTTLAQDLKAGDTVIYLTSAAGWSTTYSYGFYMIIWNYKNSFGYTYPACTYSRTRLTLPKNGNYLNSANLNKTTNTITLATAYSGQTIPAGTSVSQGGDGATYKYFPCSNTTIPTIWTSYSGKISGVDYSGQNKAGIFPPGTAYAKVGFLWNYQGSGNGEQLWVTNLSVTDTTAASNAQAAADKAQSDVDNLASNVATNYATKSEVTQTANSITSSVQSVEMIATTALSQGVEYIVGTQTAATNAWTGVTKSESLFVGKTIAYKLPYAGNSSAASLNLTLPDGTKTGAKELRRISSTVTTNYAAGTVINMTYDGTYWRIADYDSNTYDRIRYSQAIKCGTTAIVAANIIVGENGVYKHLKLGTAFDITYPILYASGAIAANATGTNNYVSMPFAVKTTQNLTLTAYKPVYIKGTLSGKMFTPASTAPLTQTEPTSADGYFYILLGTAYSTTNMYLLPEHPLFKYDNGAFKAIEQIVIENQSRITQTENSISSIVENYATKTEVTQTASDLTVTITQAQNTADTAKTAAENAQSTANTAKTNAATAQSTADTAKTNAATAQTAANNAAKTATNYLKFDSSGLLVGDMTASTLGKNVLINSSGVEIRSGTTKLASFSANTIELGGVSTISKISLLNGIGVIEAVDRTGTYNSDSLSLSLNDDVTTNPTYLSMNAESTTLRAKAINIISGSGGLTLSAGIGTASLAVSSGFAMVNAPYFNIGNALGSYSKQSEIPYLKWNTWNSKTPYFGYASDQTDGTFVWSITGTNYASGLAIGGGTGNLLYKGSKVPTISDTATTSAAGVMSSDDKMKLNQTNITYGVCPTAAATAAKTVAITGNTKWVLTIGSIICIEFDYTNTASNPTLNVNGTGAKNIYYGTAQITTSNLSYAGYAGRKMMFMYDGTGYWFMGWSYDANTNTQLRVYRQDASGYNGDYPLIASRTKAASLGTVGTESSYEAVYGLISDTNANIPTTNPYTGEVKVKKLTVDGSTRLAVASARGSSSSVALVANTITVVPLDTWITRNDSAFTFSGGGIKCPYAGNVMISGNVYFNGSNTTGMEKGVYIFKNGTTELQSQMIKNERGSGGLSSGVAIIPVAAGDVITLHARVNVAHSCNSSNVATILNVAYV